jgi:hypothetical protein
MDRYPLTVCNICLEMTVTKFKTDPHYIGPYEIVRRTARGNYVLKELDGTIHAQPYATFRIITYICQNFPWLAADIIWGQIMKN